MRSRASRNAPFTRGDRSILAGSVCTAGSPLTTHQIICLLLHHAIVNRRQKGRVIKALTTTSMVDKICARHGLELVETGVGYVSSDRVEADLEGEVRPRGVMSVDAIFTPVRKVNFTVENTRVGQDVDREKLILKRLHATPLRRWQLVGSNILMRLLIAVFQTAIIVGVGRGCGEALEFDADGRARRRGLDGVGQDISQEALN